MPADPGEVRDAEEERVRIHASRGPNRILGRDGKVTGLETLDCLSVFDATGRFSPTFAPGSERVIEADTVVMAIGQAADLSWLSPDDGVEITARGTLRVDPVTLATTAPGVFAGGDVAFGPRIAIEAVANGRRAARSIHAYLQGEDVVPATRFEITAFDPFEYEQIEGFERIPRQPVPSLPIDRRIGIAQVELGYDEPTARREASRCLRCWVNTAFEIDPATGQECLLCGGCVDVCPMSCLQLVSFDCLAAGDADTRVPLTPGESGGGVSVLVKDETACIRCGLCAKRCPVGLIEMQAFEEREVLA